MFLLEAILHYWQRFCGESHVETSAPRQGEEIGRKRQHDVKNQPLEFAAVFFVETIRLTA